MTSQHDKPKRWQFGLRTLLYVNVAVAVGIWFWWIIYRIDFSSDEPIPNSRLLHRSIANDVATCVLVSASALSLLLVGDFFCRRFANRFRPRFSIRTLVIVVTLVCCYAACWGPTKRRGVKDVVASLGNASDTSLLEDYGHHFADSEMPLIVRVSHPDGTRRHYFWFFGYVAKLPYERELDSTS